MSYMNTRRKTNLMTTEQQGLADGETICMANLHLATAQQVFDQIVKHLTSQGKRAVMATSDRVVCRYRVKDQATDNILQCAAGCLIAYDEYAPSMENQPWGSIAPNTAHSVLIALMQHIHDAHPVAMWPHFLGHAATQHSLDRAVVDHMLKVWTDNQDKTGTLGSGA